MSCCANWAIDVHTHVVPENFPAYVKANSSVPWPSMVPAHDCHRHVMVSGKIYRTVSDRCWDTERRLADMDELNIGKQVLSPMPELLSYWLDADDGAALTRYINEEIARMVSARPDRFFGLGAVPLQDVDRAISELDFVLHQLGLAGVEIGGNVNGRAIGSPEFDPFWAAAEKWGAAIFVHPLRPSGLDRLVGPKSLQQVLAFPGETGLAAASLLTGGTIERFPHLRIAFSHGGGSLRTLLPRLQHAWESSPVLKESIVSSPSEAARRLYFDDLVYEARSIEELIYRFGETQILCGSDFPFAIRDRDPAGRIARLEIDDATKILLLQKNAERWLGV